MQGEGARRGRRERAAARAAWGGKHRGEQSRRRAEQTRRECARQLLPALENGGAARVAAGKAGATWGVQEARVYTQVVAEGQRDCKARARRLLAASCRPLKTACCSPGGCRQSGALQDGAGLQFRPPALTAALAASSREELSPNAAAASD